MNTKLYYTNRIRVIQEYLAALELQKQKLERSIQISNEKAEVTGRKFHQIESALKENIFPTRNGKWLTIFSAEKIKKNNTHKNDFIYGYYNIYTNEYKGIKSYADIYDAYKQIKLWVPFWKELANGFKEELELIMPEYNKTKKRLIKLQTELLNLDMPQGENSDNGKDTTSTNQSLTEKETEEKKENKSDKKPLEHYKLTELCKKYAKKFDLIKGETLHKKQVKLVYDAILGEGYQTTMDSVGAKLRSLGYKKDRYA